MEYKITVQEISEEGKTYGRTVYEQIVTDMDIDKVIKAASDIETQ
jgi:hypothetical protein